MSAEDDGYRLVNEKDVEDITIKQLYKPHTLTILCLLAAFSVYTAIWHPTGDSTPANVFAGLQAAGLLFLVVSAMSSPNGPFTRPHPVLWRVVFGVSVLYALLLQFALRQSYGDVKAALTWLDPQRLSRHRLEEKAYAEACWDFRLENVLNSLDIFVLAHFVGWVVKALLIRHTVICWYISILWELTELFFDYLLPNFKECWWDAIVLDILLCNGLGIYCGIKLCKFLEFHEFHWESIKEIQTAGGKVRRAVLQFTPVSWMRVDWFRDRSLRRCVAMFVFIMCWLLAELNTFFLKHVFAVETRHPLVAWRLVLIVCMSAPAIRQYYRFATEPRVTRLGMQCWLWAAVCLLELAVCLKFGRTHLPPVRLPLLFAWLALLILSTVVCVWLAVKWTTTVDNITHVVNVRGQTRNLYKCGSAENLVPSDLASNCRTNRGTLDSEDEA